MGSFITLNKKTLTVLLYSSSRRNLRVTIPYVDRSFSQLASTHALLHSTPFISTGAGMDQMTRGAVEVTLAGEGFSYGCLNKAGKISLSNAAKIFESGRVALVKLGIGQALAEGNCPTAATFVRSQKLTLQRAFHTSAGIASPWVLRMWVSYVGRTSFCFESDLRCKKTGSLLGHCLCPCVMVDRATHRAIDVPAKGVFAKYRESTTVSSPPRIDIPVAMPAPSKIFTCSITALPSDTDELQHVNHSVSFRLCTDCASLAAAKGGFLRKFSRDVVYYDVKSFQVEYVGEMKVGMVIDCMCWEDANNAAVLYFLLRVGERVVGRCMGEWYTAPDGTLVVTQKSLFPQTPISNL